MANDQLEKSFSTLTNGTEELQKLPGYSFYWQADHFGMYNAYGLKEGPSRELLAIHTPIGIIEPTRVVFGEKTQDNQLQLQYEPLLLLYQTTL